MKIFPRKHQIKPIRENFPLENNPLYGITNIQVVVLDQVITLVSNVPGANRNASYAHAHMKGMCANLAF